MFFHTCKYCRESVEASYKLRCFFFVILFIKELQESSLTLSNARNLSALINVREYLQNVTQSVPDSLERELNDILPQYKNYCAVKRQYQLGQATDDLVVVSMRQVCKEVKEFLLILYQNTDTKIERNMIKRMLEETEEAL